MILDIAGGLAVAALLCGLGLVPGVVYGVLVERRVRRKLDK